jgi:predicted permease
VLAVALAIAASVAAGVASERRYGRRAQEATRQVITALLWVVLPFVTFFTLARLEIDAGVGVGLLLAYVELGIVAVLAYVAGTRLLGLDRASTGALILVAALANTGYLGIPLVGALLGGDALGAAIAFDTVVSGPMFFVVGFAIGAAFGTTAGETRGERARGVRAAQPAARGARRRAARARRAGARRARRRGQGARLRRPPGRVLHPRRQPRRGGRGGRAGLPAPLRRGDRHGARPALAVAPLLMLGLVAVTVDVPDAYLVQAAMPTGINSLIVAHAYGLDLRLISAALAWSTGIVIAAALVLAAV